MQVSAEEIRRVMLEKTDEELWKVLSVASKDHTAEATRIAREEGRRRGWGEGPVKKPMTASAGTAGSGATGTTSKLSATEEANVLVGDDAESHPRIKGYVLAFGLFCALSLLVNGGSYLYTQTHAELDSNGWLQHEYDTPVWIKSEWLTGEYRTCEVPVLPGQTFPGSTHLLCPPGEQTNFPPSAFINNDDTTGEEWTAYFTGQWSTLDSRFHVLPVTYWGRIDRADKGSFEAYSWRCVREEGWAHEVSLRCWALN